MRRTIIAVLLFLNGVGAALPQPAPAKQDLTKPAATKQAPQQNGNCIGVVSNLGEKFTVRRIGSSVFGNEINVAPVDSWHIDDLVVAKISAALSKRTAVRRIPYRRGAFVSRATLQLFRVTEAEIGQGVRTLMAGTRCARYLFVTGRIGVIRAGIGELFTKVNAYARFSLRLYDGETFTLLKRASAPSDESVWLRATRSPYRQLDESFWPESPRSAAQNTRLREAIRELVGEGMDATLTELTLTE